MKTKIILSFCLLSGLNVYGNIRSIGTSRDRFNPNESKFRLLLHIYNLGINNLYFDPNNLLTYSEFEELCKDERDDFGQPLSREMVRYLYQIFACAHHEYKAIENGTSRYSNEDIKKINAQLRTKANSVKENYRLFFSEFVNKILK